MPKPTDYDYNNFGIFIIFYRFSIQAMHNVPSSRIIKRLRFRLYAYKMTGRGAVNNPVSYTHLTLPTIA